MRFARREPQDRSCWHQWFAWHPVLTLHGDYVWLERVLRRGSPCLIANGDGQLETMWLWEYQA
jgi:hypothetical protein